MPLPAVLTVAAYALQFLDKLPGLIASGMNIKSTIDAHRAKMQVFADEKRNPTPEEWEEQNKRLDALEKRLQAPDQGAQP